MFSYNKKNILYKNIGFRYNDSHKSKWWLKDESLVSVAREIPAAVDKCFGSSPPDNFEVIKILYDRLILRVPPNLTGRSFVAKIFKLTCLRHKLKYPSLKYYRFAFAEAANLIIAAQRGIAVPKVYGYGCIYGPLGLIKKSIVIIEDLAHHKSIGNLLDSNHNNCADILDRTIPVFVSLYNAGCNNIDINLGSIMLDIEDSGSHSFLLDFEYARFHEKPSIEILMSEAANFVKCFTGRLNDEIINKWLSRLLDAVEIREAPNRGKAIERFNQYRFGRRLSRKERFRIH